VGGTRCGAWRGHTRQGCARASGICDVDGVVGMGDVGRQGRVCAGAGFAFVGSDLFKKSATDRVRETPLVSGSDPIVRERVLPPLGSVRRG
jgi:hypothetical protein